MSQVRRKEGLKLRKNLPGYFLMAPSSDLRYWRFLCTLFFRGIYLSFLNYNPLYAQIDTCINTFAGLQNYIDIF